MKKIYLILIVMIFCGLTGCKDFLTEKAYDTYTTDNFPKTASDAESLVNQMYRQAGDIYGNRYLWLSELPSGMVTTRRSGSDRRAQLDEYHVVNTNDYSADFWRDSYQAIKQANAVIAIYQGESSINKNLAKRLVAEAKVIRANTYFNLAVFYGGVPLILKRINSLEQTANKISSLADVYKAVIKDLTDAIPNLPDSYQKQEDQGRVTRGAARALLGSVYLQRAADPQENVREDGDYQKALKWLRKVRDQVDGGKKYALEPSFKNLFALKNIESAKSSNEIVFQYWRSEDDCCDNGIHQHVAPRGSNFGSVEWGNLVAEVPFYLSYDQKDDQRFGVTFLDTIKAQYSASGKTLTYDVNNPGTDGFQADGVPFTKWVDINSTDGSGGNNIFLIRYSGVLLMVAESINESNHGPTVEAYNAINTVRERAGLKDLSGLTYNEFHKAVFNERRWELTFEGHGLRDGQRFFKLFKQRVEAHPSYVQPPVPQGMKEDPHRRHDAVPEGPIHVTKQNIRFPIPLTEIDSNPLAKE